MSCLTVYFYIVCTRVRIIECEASNWAFGHFGPLLKGQKYVGTSPATSPLSSRVSKRDWDQGEFPALTELLLPMTFDPLAFSKNPKLSKSLGDQLIPELSYPHLHHNFSALTGSVRGQVL